MDGEQFKSLYKRLSLTQAELAIILGMSNSMLSNYCRNVAPIPKHVELAMAAIAIGVRAYDGSSTLTITI